MRLKKEASKARRLRNYNKSEQGLEDKNKLKGIEYNTARMETIIVDDNFKNFSSEEIRLNDYNNSRISSFNFWNKQNTNISSNTNANNPDGNFKTVKEYEPEMTWSFINIVVNVNFNSYMKYFTQFE